MLLSLRENADFIALTRKVARYGADNGIGLTFGEYQVRQVLDNVRSFVDAILTRVPRPLALLVTSYPGENDAMDLFEEQLNIWRGADPDKSSLLKFLTDIWSLSEVEGILVAIWDSMVPELGSMPMHKMEFNEFIDWLRGYYRRQVSRQGADGIFIVRKLESRPLTHEHSK